jgi:hypothetical protein
MSFFLLVSLPACIESEVQPVEVERDTVPSGLGQTDTGDGVESVDGADQLPVAYPVLINELVPVNRDSLVDLDGSSPDWIELINPHDHAIDVTDFGLSDDPGDPFQLVLPPVTLLPGQVMLVRASGRDESVNGHVHAPFKLDALGETVLLTGPDGRTHDRVETPRLYFDQSMGRDSESLAWVYYLSPTPLAENLTEGRPGFAAAPEIGPDGGFHTTEQSVTIQAASDAATVYVTTDGERPTTDGTVYTEPFVLSGKVANVVRAMAVVDGLWPSPVTTRTLFLDREITMPVWSITSSDADLFDEETGIMAVKNLFENIEIDTHLEFYEDDGTLILATDAGLKVHGGATRLSAQKGMRLLFREGYGTAPFEHPLFPDNPVVEFDRLILRNGGHDDGQTEIRDALTHQLVRDLDVDVQAWRPAIVFLNGAYWGFYNTREKQDRFYVEDHHGVDPDDLDFLEYDGWIVNEGTNEDYLALFDEVVNGDMTDPAQFAVVKDWVDLQEYALYTIAEIFSGNYDWPGNNIQFWRPREDGGKWRWTLYDTESGWYNWITPSYNSIEHATVVGRTWWPYPNWSTSLFRNMLQAPEFRDLWVNTYADLLNTRFKPAQTLPVWDAMVDEIAAEIPVNHDRWGYNPDTWPSYCTKVRTFLNERPGYTVQHIVFEFGLQGTWDLSLDVDPPGAGQVDLQVISVEEPFTGTYYLDVPVTLTAEPADGWVFVGWSDPELPVDSTVVLDPDGDYDVVALFELAE